MLGSKPASGVEYALRADAFGVPGVIAREDPMQHATAPHVRPSARTFTIFLLFLTLLLLALSLVVPKPAAAGVPECRAAAVRAAATFTKKRAKQMLACRAAGGCDAPTSVADGQRARRRGLHALNLACLDVGASDLGLGESCPDPTGRCAGRIDSHDALVACLLCMVTETVEPLIRRLDGTPSGVAEPCGGCAAGVCEAGSYCEPPPGSCHETPEVGACTQIPEACPQVVEPVCGCDGVTYDNDCTRRQHRTGLLHPGPCQDQCGSANGQTCPDGTFCEGLPGRCDIALGIPIDVPSDGACVPVPSECAQIYHPVCGCDGVTYGNDCARRAAAMQLAHEGPCEIGCGIAVPGVAGDPIVGGVCGPGTYCELPPGLCEEIGVPGVCVPRPEVCAQLFLPVCGCDGQTYSNDCARMAAGVSKRNDGPCAEPCGGFAGTPCPDGQRCELPPGTCNAADLQGHCLERPGACPDYVDPVCGCDGQTYSNDCDRQAAGVQVDHHGPCLRPCDDAAPCSDGEVCLPAPGTCDAGASLCQPIPTACPLSPDAPFPLLAVCGCDGRTYDSACEAIRAKAAVAHPGTCESELSCVTDAECGDGDRCLPIPGLCLVVADPAIGAPIVPSVCTAVPDECVVDGPPVCGCDLLDYPSPCEANRAGVGVAYPGPCVTADAP